MTSASFEVSSILGEMNEIAAAGYALGFHINYTTPKFMFQTYPKEWLDHYSQNGLVMSDPMVAWGFDNVGSCRWSELDDPAGVMTAAANYGMAFGAVIAVGNDQKKSIGGFSHGEREFSDEEIEKLTKAFASIHDHTADQAQLTDETVEQLRKMSIMVTHPGS